MFSFSIQVHFSAVNGIGEITDLGSEFKKLLHNWLRALSLGDLGRSLKEMIGLHTTIFSTCISRIWLSSHKVFLFIVNVQSQTRITSCLVCQIIILIQKLKLLGNASIMVLYYSQKLRLGWHCSFRTRCNELVGPSSLATHYLDRCMVNCDDDGRSCNSWMSNHNEMH